MSRDAEMKVGTTAMLGITKRPDQVNLAVGCGLWDEKNTF